MPPNKIRKVKIILFHPGILTQKLDHYLFQGATTIYHPFEYRLKKRDLQRRLSAIIIWDSAMGKRSLRKLEEIKSDFPSQPVFLITDNPSKEYLLAAIKLKASDIFVLPLNKEDLQQAILAGLGKPGRFTSLPALIRQWWVGLFHLLELLVAKTSFLWRRQRQDIEAVNNFSFTTFPSLSLQTRQLEMDKFHDLNIQFFADFVIKIHGKIVPKIKGRKYASLLAYLLYNHQRSIHKDILMEKFWAEYPPSSARNSLNVAICHIRKNIAKIYRDQEVIIYDSDNYSVNPELEIFTDVEQFNYFWKKGRAIESSQGLRNALGAYNKAVGIYKGEFLQEMRFEDWCESERDNLKETYLFILNRLSAHFFAQRQYDACINIGKKMLLKDNCLEEVHRKLMECYYTIGLCDLALKQYFKCEKILKEELNMEPSEATRQVLERIQKGEVIAS